MGPHFELIIMALYNGSYLVASGGVFYTALKIIMFYKNISLMVAWYFQELWDITGNMHVYYISM